MQKKNSYPWNTLVNVGDSFTLTETDGAGFKFARQLVFARNSTCKRQNKPDRFKCEKQVDGSMKISKQS